MALELRSGQLESMYSHVKKVNEHRFLTLLLNEYKRLVKPKSAEPKIDINKARPYVIKLLLAGNYDITERIMEERNKQPLKDLYDLRMRIPELTIELLSGLMPHLSDKFVFGATEKDISIISTANPTADYKELNKTTEIAKSTKRVLLDFDALRAISYAA